ncbi:hypothetical protein SLS58_000545 [Diplodia intermedia]|uniref:Uncharacterized protein n=1 Tax=Diplodia intermedia TaxID=856260 RepID=A0ABR3U461_9PEZI
MSTSQKTPPPPPPPPTNQSNTPSPPPATTKTKEATSDAYLTGRPSTDTTVSTLPEYTEKSENSSNAAAAAGRSGAAHQRLGSTFDRVKAKMGREPDSPERAEEKARRRQEYERLGLGDRTKYGVGGMSWSG